MISVDFRHDQALRQQRARSILLNPARFSAHLPMQKRRKRPTSTAFGAPRPVIRAETSAARSRSIGPGSVGNLLGGGLSGSVAGCRRRRRPRFRLPPVQRHDRGRRGCCAAALSQGGRQGLEPVAWRALDAHIVAAAVGVLAAGLASPPAEDPPCCACTTDLRQPDPAIGAAGSRFGRCPSPRPESTSSNTQSATVRLSPDDFAGDAQLAPIGRRCVDAAVSAR